MNYNFNDENYLLVFGEWIVRKYLFSSNEVTLSTKNKILEYKIQFNNQEVYINDTKFENLKFIHEIIEIQDFESKYNIKMLDFGFKNLKTILKITTNINYNENNLIEIYVCDEDRYILNWDNMFYLALRNFDDIVQNKNNLIYVDKVNIGDEYLNLKVIKIEKENEDVKKIEFDGDIELEGSFIKVDDTDYKGIIFKVENNELLPIFSSMRNENLIEILNEKIEFEESNRYRVVVTKYIIKNEDFSICGIVKKLDKI